MAARRAARAASGAPGLAGGCGAAFAGLAVVAALPRDSWPGRLDGAVADAVAARRTAAWVRAARAVSALGEPGPVAIPLTAAALAAARQGGWRACCGPFLAVAAGMAVRRKLSQVIARPRPPAALWLAEPEGFSLPSKHTSLAALTAGACASAVGAGRGTSQVAALLAAAGVGAGRVCLGVHWPGDVLAGWLFSAGWLDLYRWLQPAAAMPWRRPGTGRTTGREGTGRTPARPVSLCRAVLAGHHRGGRPR